MTTRPIAAISLVALAACSPAHKAEIASAESTAASAVMSAITPVGKPTHFLGNVNLDESITLVGTEPFWNILFGDGRMVFSSPDSHTGETTDTPFILTKAGAEWHGKTMDIYLTAVRCSDGMSDRGYPLKAVIHIGETVLKGCGGPTEVIRPASNP